MTTRCAPKELQGRQKRVRRHPEPLVEHGEGDFTRASVPLVSLEPARRATPEHLPHQDSKIEGAGVGLAVWAASTCSAAAIAVSPRLVVSPTSAPCRVTATIAPLSRSMACSALCARCVRPSFIFVIFASGSNGFFQSLFDVRFF